MCNSLTAALLLYHLCTVCSTELLLLLCDALYVKVKRFWLPRGQGSPLILTEREQKSYLFNAGVGSPHGQQALMSWGRESHRQLAHISPLDQGTSEHPKVNLQMSSPWASFRDPFGLQEGALLWLVHAVPSLLNPVIFWWFPFAGIFDTEIGAGGEVEGGHEWLLESKEVMRQEQILYRVWVSWIHMSSSWFLSSQPY